MGFLDSIKNKKYINAIHPDVKNLVYIEKHVPEHFNPNIHDDNFIKTSYKPKHPLYGQGGVRG